MTTILLILVALTGCSVTISEMCETSTYEDPTFQPGEPYRCADQYQNRGDGCGTDGYALGYGAKYAERFMWETYDIVEPATQDFLIRNLICLQESFIFDTTPEMTCQELSSHAFDSHIHCYLESGVCELSITDLFKILGTIDEQDMSSEDADAAIEGIFGQCWG
jgi:hypothetical protein